MITKIKPCRFCGETTHYPYQCLKNPKRKPFSPKQRVNYKLYQLRKIYFKEKPQEYFNCYYCGKLLRRDEVELDHYISRSRRPDLRYELSNIVPSCHDCNTLKGSLSGDEFKAKLRSAA